MEATANREMIVPLFLAAIIADAVSIFVCHDKLYHGLATLFDAKLRLDDQPKMTAQSEMIIRALPRNLMP